MYCPYHCFFHYLALFKNFLNDSGNSLVPLVTIEPIVRAPNPRWAPLQPPFATSWINGNETSFVRNQSGIRYWRSENVQSPCQKSDRSSSCNRMAHFCRFQIPIAPQRMFLNFCQIFFISGLNVGQWFYLHTKLPNRIQNLLSSCYPPLCLT